MRPRSFGILGPLDVALAGRPVTVQGSRRRALLGRLLVSANQLVSADRLIEDLWGDDLPSHPLNALQSCVSYLRSIIEPGRGARQPSAVLVTRAPGYALTVAPEDLDSLRFQQLVSQGRSALASAQFHEAAERLSEALAQWRGPLLPEFGDERWATVEGARLGELRAAAWEDRIEAELALGHHGAVVAELEAALALHPLRERLYAQFMVALYRCGRQAEALRVFAGLRRVLADEMGIEPSPELRRLEEAILLQKPELDWQAPAAAGTTVDEPTPRRPHNLPAPLSDFVGRHAELAALRELLRSTRLLTLTGTGGVGKTRLALQLGADVLCKYSDGVWLVELAGTSDASLVATQLRMALDLTEETGASSLDTVLCHVRTRHMLLVLDNCEHLADSCASVVDALLRGCPQLGVVVTSRERLRMEGETVWVVPPLSLPEEGPPGEAPRESDALRLFVQRVMAARGGGALSEAEERVAADICRLLDGIPLALELAAARANVLSLAEIATRLGDRFALLAAPTRSVTARHRTLRAAVDWTYDALPEPERGLFERLSIFAGGFALEAAEQVCAGDEVARGDVFAGLVGLTEKSLVSVVRRDGSSRYSILETLRQYGAEKLVQRGDEEGLRERHLSWALSLGESADAALTGPDARRWLAVVDDEYDNLQAALVWAHARGHHEKGLRLAVSIHRYCDMRGRADEGRTWLERFLPKASDVDPRLKATAFAAASSLAFVQNDPGAAERLARTSAAVAEATGSPAEIATAYLALGAAASLRHDLRTAADCHRGAVDSARRASNPFLLATALVNLGNVTMGQGDLAGARPLLDESLRIRRELGNAASVGRSLSYLGLAAQRGGRFDDAERLFEESVRTLRDARDDRGLLQGLLRYGELRLAMKQFGAAATLYAEAARIGTRTGSFAWLGMWLLRAAEAAAGAGQPVAAGFVLGAAGALLSAVAFDAEKPPAELEEFRQVLARLRAGHANAEFEVALDAMNALSQHQALQEAIHRLLGLGTLRAVDGRVSEPESEASHSGSLISVAPP